MGIIQRNLNIDSSKAPAVGINLLGNSYTYTFERGKKLFELPNHLGNVLSTISDKRQGKDTTGDGIIDYYLADVTTAQDYYPFGMLMPGRSGYAVSGGWASGGSGGTPQRLSISSRSGGTTDYVASEEVEFNDYFESPGGDEFSAYISADNSSGSSSGGSRVEGSSAYRYGFNGKENDNEVKGEGSQQDYGMRIYNPRLGRFLSVDPLNKSYPWYTPYQFAGNKPITFIDRDGLEEASPMDRNQAKSYFEKSIKPYISKYASSRAFANMNPQSILTQLGEALKDPGSLKESGAVGNMCGVYAFTYAFALYKPLEFARGVADLFITGTSHDIGGLDVIPDNGLKNAGNNTGNSLPALVFGGSVRSHYNQFVGYGFNRYFGSTSSSTMKAWLEDRLGVEVKEFEYGHEYFLNGITDDDMKTLSNHLNSGKQALVRLNAGQFRKGLSATTFDPEGDISGGDHWIVLNGKMSINEAKKTVTVQAYDVHRGLETRTFSTKVFKDMINHVLMISKKEDKKE